MDMGDEEILLVYDKECPVCHAYCKNVRIDHSHGDLKMIDARRESDVMAEITARGLDIDQGMVVKRAGHLYYGSEAIQELALLSSRSSFFGRLNALTFGTRASSRMLYPLLRSLRNLLLKFLGRTKINNLGQSNNDYF
jgi:predicted DCC family thiol-disulfide oxidoreductase YuxK